jgi:rare lipoprotein A
MMQKVKIGLAVAALLSCVGTKAAQARSGLAAYHLHTSSMVTASRYEPRGSILRVTNPRNGRSVRVRVNDAGPYNGNRILDLSTGAFSRLFGGLGRGTGPIRYTVVSRGGTYLASRGGSPRSRYGKRKVSRRQHHRHRRSR